MSRWGTGRERERGRKGELRGGRQTNRQIDRQTNRQQGEIFCNPMAVFVPFYVKKIRKWSMASGMVRCFIEESRNDNQYSKRENVKT